MDRVVARAVARDGLPHPNPAAVRTLYRDLRRMDRVMARAVARDGLPHPIPASVRTLYRGTRFENLAIVDAGGAHRRCEGPPQTGALVQIDAFASTSFALARSLLYARTVLLRFDVGGQWRGARWVYSPLEEEVIIDRGTTWRVVRVWRDVPVPAACTVHPRQPSLSLAGAVVPVVTVIDLAAHPSP